MGDSEITSPCIGVCELDSRSGLCLGCLRTLDEITAWRDADDGARARILQRLAARRAAGYATVDRRGRPTVATAKPLV